MIALLVLLLSVPRRAAAGACPAVCACSAEGEVDCGERGLETVPPGLPTAATALSLAGNRLSDVLGGQLPPLPQLRRLDLSRNGLRQLGRGTLFRGMDALKELDLSRNAYRTVLNGVFRNCRGLTKLSMAQGHIKWIEEHAFDNLTKLEELHLHHNQLSALFPEWFSDLSSLRDLRLDNNQLAFVNGGSFAGLAELRHLGLSGNRIRGFSDRALDGLVALESLEAQDNALVKVPRLGAAQALQEARFGGNPLRALRSGDFEALPRLETVSAEGCAEMEEVQGGAFTDLPRLRAAHLHGNARLRYVDPGAFVRAPGLRLLSLHGCGLEALSGALLSAFAQPLQLSLRGNPLRCDCNIRWIHQLVLAEAANDSVAVANSTTNSDPPVRLLSAETLQCDGLPLRTVPSLPTACAPRVVEPAHTSFTLRVGEPLALRCLAHGLPPPSVHWELPSGDRHQDISIPHVSPEDAGRYSCVADNPLGRSASQVTVRVESLDIHLFALSATPSSVTLVWNGTARNAFPEYELVSRPSAGGGAPRSATVGQFLRSYTVGHLRPDTAYSFCLGLRGESRFVTLSCTASATSDAEGGVVVWRTSNVAVAAVVAVIASMSGVVCAAVVAARKYRHRLYDTPEKSLVGHMAHIPLENLHSPLVAR